MNDPQMICVNPDCKIHHPPASSTHANLQLIAISLMVAVALSLLEVWVISAFWGWFLERQFGAIPMSAWFGIAAILGIIIQTQIAMIPGELPKTAKAVVLYAIGRAALMLVTTGGVWLTGWTAGWI